MCIRDRDSLARYSRLTQGLKDRFTSSNYPLVSSDRVLTDTIWIPEKNGIVMDGDMEPPKFWHENVRWCSIGTGVNQPTLTCEVYFIVTQSKYSIYANPSVTLEYLTDDLAPHGQLAMWFRDFLTREYDVDVVMRKCTE